MARCSLTIFTVITLFSRYMVNGASYTAGVVEFASETLLRTETPQQLIMRNAHRYVEIINKAAAHDVDIVVFPECGLTSIAVPVVRNKITAYMTEMPNIGANPCDHLDAPKVLRTLSCAARSSSIYVVFNLDEVVHCPSHQPGCPADGLLFYNTNLALDRSGTVIAKYRKFNLFVEPEFNKTKEPEHSWFDTDFGVRFGMFICFDILFKEPAYSLISRHHISDFVFSTAWFSELPFLSATSVQAAWACANDVNLLASGYSNTTNKNAGSGIYAGRDGALTAVMPDQSSTKLLIARVSSDQRGIQSSPREEITFTEDSDSALDFLHDSLESFTNVVVKGDNTQLQYNNEGFACNISVDSSKSESGPTYRLVAFSGLRSYGLVRTVHIEVCGIVACADATLSSCGYNPSFHSSEMVLSAVRVSASSDKTLLSYPITLDKKLLPFQTKYFQFTSQKSAGRHEMTLVTKHSLKNIITFAVFRNGLKL